MPIVRISEDEMSADLVLLDGEVIASPNVAIVLLARHGVRHGLLHPVLATLPELAGPVALRVAVGEPPMAGRDGWAYYTAALDPGGLGMEAPLAPWVAEDGEVLGRRHRALSGQLGRTVTGRPLAVQPVEDPPFTAGEGAELSMDGQFLVAARRGVPHLVDGTVVVHPFTRIAGGLGPESEGLTLEGDVVVEGHIEHPATVVATGDIHVLGGVQGAHLKAGGRIFVHGGVRQDALLEAAHGAHMRFIESSKVLAGGLVVVREDLIRGVVEAPCARIGGAVVGGELTLAQWLEAGALGSEFAPPTKVGITPPPPPDDPVRALARERREINEQLTRLAPLLDENRRLAKDLRNEGAREMATKLVGLIAHLQARDRELATAIAEAPEPPVGPRPYARVAGAVYPGVSLQVGAQHLRPTSAIPSSTFLEGRAAVECAPYDLTIERTPA